jgi:hypothetical protein
MKNVFGFCSDLVYSYRYERLTGMGDTSYLLRIQRMRQYANGMTDSF